MDYNARAKHFHVTLSSGNGQIQTSLHRKPTSGNGILRAESCHPKYVVKNLPIGEYVRAKRTCSSMANYLDEEKIIDKKRLRERGYGKGLLNKAN